MLLQFFEFVGNHFVLVGAFALLLALFIANEFKRGGRIVSSQELVNLVNRSKGVVIDLRTGPEFSSGHISGAVHIPYSTLNDRMGELEKYKETPVILACPAGQHSGAAGSQLKKAGFADIRRLAGGMNGWHLSNMPVIKN